FDEKGGRNYTVITQHSRRAGVGEWRRVAVVSPGRPGQVRRRPDNFVRLAIAEKEPVLPAQIVIDAHVSAVYVVRPRRVEKEVAAEAGQIRFRIERDQLRPDGID